jgi:hypothetical protein
VTPRLAGTTRESRTRAAWGVARRIDELLAIPPEPQHEFRVSAPVGLGDQAPSRAWR